MMKSWPSCQSFCLLKRQKSEFAVREGLLADGGGTVLDECSAIFQPSETTGAAREYGAYNPRSALTGITLMRPGG
jgi:hypothetical protein